MENFFSNSVQTTSQTSISKSTTYVIILLVLISITIILIWYFWPRADHVTAMGPWNLNGPGAALKDKQNSTETVFTNADIEQNLGNNFTLSFFLYMSEVNREQIPIGGPSGDFRFKPLVFILGVGDILIDPIHQELHIRVKPLDRNGLLDPTKIVSIDVSNFMIARWNQVAITLEGRSLDVYVNGSIAGSALLENLPIVKPMGVLIEKSPDFHGQAGLFQAWPRRLSESEISRNYIRNTDTRRKPLIPETGPTMVSIFRGVVQNLCDIGFCGFRFQVGPMNYIDYEFA